MNIFEWYDKKELDRLQNKSKEDIKRYSKKLYNSIVVALYRAIKSIIVNLYKVFYNIWKYTIYTVRKYFFIKSKNI